MIDIDDAWSDTAVTGFSQLPDLLTEIVGVAVLAFAYHSSYHCFSYYLSDYKLGVHMYCLWPPHYYKLGVHGVAV